MTLFWQQFKAQFAGLLIWGAGAIGLVAMIASTAPSFTKDDNALKMLESMPESLQRMMGFVPGLSMIDLFVATQVGKTMALAVALYAVMLSLNAITREVDRRTIDFLLSLPVKRTEVLLARAGVMLVNSGIITAIMVIGLQVSLRAQGLEGDWGGYNLIFLNVWLLAVALGSITLLASLWIDDYSLGVKAMLGLVSAGYFLEMVMKAVALSRTARLISPFSYVDPHLILKHGALPVLDTAILVVVSVLCIGLSLPVFERKQITA